ncbi:MAG: VanW family protein [Peptococcaceae bacterium]|jgi:vancomycin resistance protein YoaR|nr:VanW family protein [Peptococcaceae bacterium]
MIFSRVALVLILFLFCPSCLAGPARTVTPGPDSPTAAEDLAGPLPLILRERMPVLLSTFTTNYIHATPSQEANIALTAKRMCGIVVAPKQVFSFNKALGPYTAERGYGMGRTFYGGRIGFSVGGGVCQVASTLYNTVLLANLRVVERTAHSMTVPYLPPGRDATIYYGVYDFKFENDSNEPVMIWAGTKDRHLTISLYGRQSPPRVEIRTEILVSSPPPVEVTGEPAWPAGREEVVTPGQSAVRSHTWLLVNGVVSRDLGVDEYLALTRRVKRGTGRT